MKSIYSFLFLFTGLFILTLTGCGTKYTTEELDGISIIYNKGGNNDLEPVIEAYNRGVDKHGEAYMKERFERSAIRLLRNIFRVGLFENPYLDPGNTLEIVGNPEYMKAGYEAQLRTVVLLKNQQQTLPLEKQLKVYIPQRHIPASTNWFGRPSPEQWIDAFSKEIVSKYFVLVETPEEADFAYGLNWRGVINDKRVEKYI